VVLIKKKIIPTYLAKYNCVSAAMYNNTSLIHPELHTDFNRLISIMMNYNYYTEPENIDEIGEKALKKYFPSGGIDDHTHINAVKVGTIIYSKP